MRKFCVIADDFTGAYDIGAQLKKKGINAKVTYPDDNWLTCNSIIIDTESRTMERKKAYYTVKTCIKKIEKESYDIYFKKVDSFFRGNVLEELVAVNEVLNFKIIVIAPSYPKLGRTIKNGIFYLNDVPLNKTDLILDPSNKNTFYDITKILGLLKTISYEHLTNIANDVGENKILSYDAETDKDLDAIIEKFWDIRQDVLWVGSIGLMNAILRKCIHTPPVLCVVGSTSNTSRQQVEMAQKCGKQVITVNLKSILGSQLTKNYVDGAVKFLQKGEDIILYTACTNYLYSILKVSIFERPIEDQLSQINDIIGKLVLEIINKAQVSGLLLTGGDTAKSVLKYIGIGETKIWGEMFTSMPVINQIVENNGSTNILIKSGRVGDMTILVEGIEKLKDIYIYRLPIGS